MAGCPPVHLLLPSYGIEPIGVFQIIAVGQYPHVVHAVSFVGLDLVWIRRIRDL